MSNYHYGQFGPEHLKAIQKGIELYNQEKFWECHEELEDPWIEDISDNARYVYWAVIQVATSLFHVRDGNLAGAKGMLFKAKKKVDECEKRRVETELLNEKLSWQEYKKLIREISDSPELGDFKKLWNFKFKMENNL